MTNIITELRSTVNTHHANVAAAQAEADKFQRDFANYYAQDVFARKMQEYTGKRDAAISAGNAAIKATVSAFLDEIKNIDALDGGKLTDDVKLLESPIKLNKTDLETMFDRAKADGNRTMLTLIMRRSLRDSIAIDRVFYTAQDIEAGVRALENYAYNALPGGIYYDMIWENDEKFRTIIPDALRDLYGIEKPYRYETSTRG